MDEPDARPNPVLDSQRLPALDIISQLRLLTSLIPALESQATGYLPVTSDIQKSFDAIDQYASSLLSGIQRSSNTGLSDNLGTQLAAPVSGGTQPAALTPLVASGSASQSALTPNFDSHSLPDTRRHTSADNSVAGPRSSLVGSSGPGRWPYPLEPTVIGRNVEVGRLQLDTVYCLESASAILEYPSTSARGIGYLIRMDSELDCWYNRTLDVAYSLFGRSAFASANVQKIPLLVDDNGQMVDCVVMNKDCE